MQKRRKQKKDRTHLNGKLEAEDEIEKYCLASDD